MSLSTTSSQTVGPYLHIGMAWLVTENLVASGVDGDPIAIEGRVTDGDGMPVSDALVEIWQANAHGRYAHPQDKGSAPLEANWTGFGRAATDGEGQFRFTTIKPGRVPAPGGGLQAPHIDVTIFMRGMLRHLVTRIYFPGEPANDEDAVLQSVPAARRATLVAVPKAGDPAALTWNARLQGADETVFFEI
ncbi:MAG TPA: protocatechuate 3,4-dioxygenase subunit alpha [Casimicrobiaceae bacterium]|nr:protocatechuate 3,4-dioxygenase subunit alpha [Casimicrobiaceae bacterium]